MHAATQQYSLCFELVQTGDKRKEELKDIYVVFPPADKDDFATTFLVPLTDNVELRDFVSIHRGNLLDKTGIKLRFEQLKNEGVYTIFGPHYMALTNDARTQKVETRMQEVNALIAVKNDLEGTRELFFNVPISGFNPNAVLLHEVSTEETTAYICESTRSPTDNDIDTLTDKAVKFQLLAKNHEVYSHVNKVVPVLAGHNWLPGIAQRATEAKLWRVQTTKSNYQVIRSLSTLVRKVPWRR
jgi:hypothetical protein